MKTPKPTTRVWWVIRRPEDYILSMPKAGATPERDGSIVLSERKEYPERGVPKIHAMIWPAEYWHRAGGPRLKIGEGPYQYRLRLVARRVK